MTSDADIFGLFFGMSTIDCIYQVSDPPGKNEKITAERQLICMGGPSSNAAIAFSALGGKATLVSCLGQHPLTTIARTELTTYGIVHVDLCAALHSVPAVSSVCVSKKNGDRAVVSVNAKNSSQPELSPEPSIDPLTLANYNLAMFDGQYMALAIQLAKRCRMAGIHTILDGGSWKPGTEELIQYIDTAICSSNFKPPAVTSLDGTLAWLNDHNVSKTAITRGEQSILVMENNKPFEVYPPKLSTVRDTLAAGDIFHGAFTYFYADSPNAPFRSLLEKSAEIAAQACVYFGPRKWIDHFR